MKKLNYLILLLACFTLFPVYSCAMNARSDKNRKIMAYGAVVQRTIDVKSFHGIDVSTGIMVVLDDMPEGQVRIETDSMFQKHIRVTVSNGILNIQIKGDLYMNNKTHRCMKVYVPISGVNKIEASASASVIAKKTITAQKFDLNLSSGASFEGSVKSDEAKLEVTSSAYAKLLGKISRLFIEANSGGKVDFASIVSEKIECEVSSGATLSIAGETDSLTLEVNSSGRVDAKELVTNNVASIVSSGGSASVCANIALKMEASSGGRILYSGNAKQIESHTSSAGSIKKQK